MRIGIFDSGIGGEAIAAALKKEFPEAAFQVVNDKAHLPYGNKSSEEIIRLTNAAIQPLLDTGCDIIVIACNSATTAAITWLRHTYPTQLFIGLEPMLKPAADLTKTGVITVCATPATLSSVAYQQLKQRVADHLTVHEPDCHDWAAMIEENSLNDEKIATMVQAAKANRSDVIVLGCTHYHWIKEKIIDLAEPGVHVLEPSIAIGHRIRTMLNRPAD